MAIDPVCGGVVSPEDAFACEIYKSREYCFCSDECEEEFNIDPDYYVNEIDELDIE